MCTLLTVILSGSLFTLIVFADDDPCLWWARYVYTECENSRLRDELDVIVKSLAFE